MTTNVGTRRYGSATNITCSRSNLTIDLSLGIKLAMAHNCVQDANLIEKLLDWFAAFTYNADGRLAGAVAPEYSRTPLLNRTEQGIKRQTGCGAQFTAAHNNWAFDGGV